MYDVDKILIEKEKVLWTGKPKFGPYFMTGLIPSFIAGLICMGFLLPFIFVGLMPLFGQANSTIADGNAVSVARPFAFQDIFLTSFFIGWNLFLIPFLLIGLWLLFGVPIYKFLLYKNLLYTITNKRIIVQNGIFGKGFDFIYFNQMPNIGISIGFWDILFGNNSGTINLSSVVVSGNKVGDALKQGSINSGLVVSGKYSWNFSYYLNNVENPYEVSKLLKEVEIVENKKVQQ